MKITQWKFLFFQLAIVMLLVWTPGAAFSEPVCNFVKSTHCKQSLRGPFTCSFTNECVDSYPVGAPYACQVEDNWTDRDLFVEEIPAGEGSQGIFGKHQVTKHGVLKSNGKMVRYMMSGNAFSKGVNEYIDDEGLLHFEAEFRFTGSQMIFIGIPRTGMYYMDASGLLIGYFYQTFQQDQDGNWVEIGSEFIPGPAHGHLDFLDPSKDLFQLTSEALCK